MEQKMKPTKTKLSLIRNCINRSPLRRGFFLIALTSFALSPAARAVDPPPDEGHANQNNTTGHLNTAMGAATVWNMMMLGNTPYGSHALAGNTAGRNNTAIGMRALNDNAMGNNNTAIGFLALNCSTGSDNIALGSNAGVYHMTGDNNIYIGNLGTMSEAGQIRIGTYGVHKGTYIAGIRYAAVTGSPVVIGADGKLGVTMSSAKFKDAIKPMDKASETILALKPVTFRYKQELDPDGIPQFGLVAEEVEKVNPDLVVRGEDGKVMTVRYEAVNAMLLNEFLKEHGKVEAQERNAHEQQSTITALKATVARQQREIEALVATVQKVSDRIERSGAAPRPVANTR
jgi:hypothetical protein